MFVLVFVVAEQLKENATDRQPFPSALVTFSDP
jgi:hypothetical protein